MIPVIRLLVAFLIPAFFASAEVLRGPVVNPANGQVYYLLTQSTWPEAENQAVALGGHLVTIDDAQENDWLCNAFGTNNIGQDIGLWIGLNDQNSEGSFTWISGLSSPYAKWSGGEPNNFGDEDYVLLWPSNGRNWYDLSNLSNMGGMPLHGVVEIFNLDCGGESILNDDFNLLVIDANKWTPYRPLAGSTVTAQEGTARLSNRGGLTSKIGLPQSYSISGTFMFLGQNDEFKVIIRSDLSTFGVEGELTGVAVGFNDELNVVYIREANRQALASVAFPFTTNGLYNFRVTDDGSLIQVYINDTTSPLLSFWTSHATGDRFGLYNRRSAAAQTSLQRIQVCTLFAPMEIHRAIELEIQTLPRYPYQIQVSSDLVFWGDLGAAFHATDTSTNVFLRAEGTPRFYRVITR